MIVGDQVAMVFYGDNTPKGLPVGETDDLEKGLQTICAHLEEASS